jgi:N-acetylglucosaminyl-diphospho-decaprenol L-rhamnosyltransferase
MPRSRDQEGTGVTAEQVDVSAIIVNWNTRDLLVQCLQSLHDTTGDQDLEVIVVDNASSDGSPEMVRKRFPQVKLIENQENVGFAQANNQAIKRCRGHYMLLLNSDTQVLPGSLDKTVRFMDEHPRTGITGVRLLNPDRTFQASYTPFPTLWQEFLMLSGLGRSLIRPTFPSCAPETGKGAQQIKGYVEGAYLMARREAVDQVGGLDERIFMYAEEVDWCYRFAQAGWEVWYLPDVAIVHYGGQSSKQRQGRMEAELYRSRVYFFHKHYGLVEAQLLRLLIYLITPAKWVIHQVARFLSGGRKGRNVVGLRELHGILSREAGLR